MFLVFNGKTRMAEEDLSKVHESSSVMLIPLIILAIGALFFGFLFKSYFIGYYSDVFWNGSIVVNHEDHHSIPLLIYYCLLYTSPSPRDAHETRMPSSA